jgi:hypothetical protein
MARDYIKITPTAPQAMLLRNFIAAQRQAYNLGVQVREMMGHNNDGADFSDIETLFGLPAGKGQTVFDLVNGAVGSMVGDFQSDDAKQITEQLG